MPNAHFLRFNYFLDELRIAWGRPLQMASLYRSPSHPIERAKKAPGTHAYAVACDPIVYSGTDLFVSHPVIYTGRSEDSVGIVFSELVLAIEAIVARCT